MKTPQAKYKEILLYFVFGVATTCVNFAAFWGLEHIHGGGDYSYLVNNVIAWLIAVVFAYVTNKLFVFQARSWALSVVLKEILEFFGARVFSLAVEEAGLWLFVEKLHFDRLSCAVFGFSLSGELIAKLALAVIVVVLNYFFSKFVIFRKKA